MEAIYNSHANNDQATNEMAQAEGIAKREE